jgi:hypothetical protein
MELAEFQAFQQDIFVFFSRKNIYPGYYCKSQEIQFILIADFVFGAHKLSESVENDFYGSLKTSYHVLAQVTLRLTLAPGRPRRGKV